MSQAVHLVTKNLPEILSHKFCIILSIIRHHGIPRSGARSSMCTARILLGNKSSAPCLTFERNDVGLVVVGGYGSSEGRCLPFSGISGRAVAVSPCSSRGVHYVHSQAQFGKMKCSFRASSIVCKSSGGHRRNPDFSRQNRQGVFTKQKQAK
ncbi:hypothetical protein NC652_004936 [Populus alba x Populus x berolinensis]|nr:hypothetical protein NC652_004936 [Populus alba x Populus x berolinensis]